DLLSLLPAVALMRRLFLLLFFYVAIPRLPPSTLFPYTTLFRSFVVVGNQVREGETVVGGDEVDRGHRGASGAFVQIRGTGQPARSEEHTSELQSRFDIVCRLLLEKKKMTLDSNKKTPRKSKRKK